MDIGQVESVMGLASAAFGMTGKAVDTVESIKKLFSSGDATDKDKASTLVNSLASQLTAANITNLELSEALKRLGQSLKADEVLERETARYELYETEKSDFVYKLKEDMADGQPMHFICPVCLKRDRLISIIRGNGDYKACQTDKKHLYQFKFTPIQPQRPTRRRFV